MRALALSVLVSLSLSFGCSSTSSPSPADDAAAPAPSPTSPAADAGAPPADAAPGVSAPAAPNITQIMKMSGALHVMWKNAEKDCDAIEAERKTPTTEYKVAFTVPGAADNKHDGTATEKVQYTYRLRCKRGDAFSAYSNERSQTP